jgi:hypothetical protein
VIGARGGSKLLDWLELRVLAASGFFVLFLYPVSQNIFTANLTQYDANQGRYQSQSGLLLFEMTVAYIEVSLQRSSG